MSDFQQTITSLDLLHTSLYRMELFMNAQAVKNAKTDVISLISRLEKAERERDEYKHRCKVSDGACAIAEQQRNHWMQRAKAAEEEIARRDAEWREALAAANVKWEVKP
ncbi:MAG: hypothetical protein [Bacteriophage sp.]|nr:MAG: hypothetical protein [Bacteriophage sp.]